MYRLVNPIRNYAWGSRTAIPSFLGLRNDSLKPQAEMWIGAHPDSPSQVIVDGNSTDNLDTLLESTPDTLLGAEAISAFGARLPFLMKILAAENALSLQVHPTTEQAKEGFQREQASKLPHDDPRRNYKDTNHKPEMILALTEFKALCGFQDPATARNLFQKLADAYRSHFTKDGTPELLEWIINTLTPEGRPENSIGDDAQRVKDVFERIILSDQTPKLVETTANAVKGWLPQQETLPYVTAEPLKTMLRLNEDFPHDPGVLLSLLLNHVRLKPGEALFLPAGNIHAYLNGLGVEVMASSDNVLRGGLTVKHVDIAELLKLVNFKILPVPRISPVLTASGQRVFRPPFKEFQFQEIILSHDADDSLPIIHNGPLIILCAEGEAIIRTVSDTARLKQADTVFIGADEAPTQAQLPPQSRHSRLFAVTVAENNDHH